MPASCSPAFCITTTSSAGGGAGEHASALVPENYRCLRNMAVARYSHPTADEALPLLDRALALLPHDSQLIWEKAHDAAHRSGPKRYCGLPEDENNPREDVIITLCHALNSGRHEARLKSWEANISPPARRRARRGRAVYVPIMRWDERHWPLGDTHGAGELRQAQVLPDNLGAGL